MTEMGQRRVRTGSERGRERGKGVGVGGQGLREDG